MVKNIMRLDDIYCLRRKKISRSPAMLATVTFSLIIPLLFCSLSYAVSPVKPKDQGAAINFSLFDLQQGKHVYLSDFKGRPVVLFFWATWCPYCREKFPELKSEYLSMKSKKISLLAIDIGEPKSRVEGFLKDRGIEFPVLLDSDSQVAESYNLIGIPTFVLIDAKGQIQLKDNTLPSDYVEILNPE